MMKAKGKNIEDPIKEEIVKMRRYIEKENKAESEKSVYSSMRSHKV